VESGQVNDWNGKKCLLEELGKPTGFAGLFM